MWNSKIQRKKKLKKLKKFEKRSNASRQNDYDYIVYFDFKRLIKRHFIEINHNMIDDYFANFSKIQ